MQDFFSSPGISRHNFFQSRVGYGFMLVQRLLNKLGNISKFDALGQEKLNSYLVSGTKYWRDSKLND